MNIVVNLDKQRGITSQDAVTQVKRLFKVRKAGHAGTLDPIATGILLVCLNEATKITSFLSDLDKEYVVTAKLGESTDTYDAEGMIVQRAENLTVREADIVEVLKRFSGDIEQTPPMYSAIKVSGRPLYELARKGIEVPREKRRVKVHSVEIERFESPFVTLRVGCSKGTYIRTLCHDIGNTLGIGAHVTELARTRIGDFTIGDAASLGELPHKASALSPLDGALRHLAEVTVGEDNLKRARHGNPFPIAPPQLSGLSSSGFIRLKDPEGRLFGIGKIGNEVIKIERLFNL